MTKYVVKINHEGKQYSYVATNDGKYYLYVRSENIPNKQTRYITTRERMVKAYQYQQSLINSLS